MALLRGSDKKVFRRLEGFCNWEGHLKHLAPNPQTDPLPTYGRFQLNSDCVARNRKWTCLPSGDEKVARPKDS